QCGGGQQCAGDLLPPWSAKSRLWPGIELLWRGGDRASFLGAGVLLGTALQQGPFPAGLRSGNHPLLQLYSGRTTAGAGQSGRRPGDSQGLRSLPTTGWSTCPYSAGLSIAGPIKDPSRGPSANRPPDGTPV